MTYRPAVPPPQAAVAVPPPQAAVTDAQNAVLGPNGVKIADLTGPGITDALGVGGTDLGVSIVAPNGSIVSAFGDTFGGPKPGSGDWRAPVLLIGSGDATGPLRWDRAGGPNPNHAEQPWFYIHDSAATGWTHGGFSTVIPSDLLRVGDRMYLHVMVNRDYPNVVWTEIWTSADSGVSWTHMGEQAKFDAGLHDGRAQLWSWDYNPDDGWVYVVSTGNHRDTGIILRRVRPADIGDRDAYLGWGFANSVWSWGNEPTPITPPGEQWGELCLRRLAPGKWVLGGFLSSARALGYRTITGPTANLYLAPVQMPVVASPWSDEDHAHGRVAQLYGGYLLPGSRLDVPGGVGLVVSQWNTNDGWPYRAMQFAATLRDTTA